MSKCLTLCGRFRRTRNCWLILLFVLLFCALYKLGSNRPIKGYMVMDGNRLCVKLNGSQEQICGQKFSDSYRSLVSNLDDIPQDIQFKDEEVIFVAYASSNHFIQSRNAIRSIRKLTKQKIVYYDLGLRKHQVDDLSAVCNLEIIEFNFTAYPTYVKDLLNYSFKPLIILESYKRFNAFWIIDGSVTFGNGPQLSKFYEKVRNGHIDLFLAEHPSGHSITYATAKKTFDFLPLPEDVRHFQMRQAAMIFIVRSQMSTKLIKLISSCALTESCIAPVGSDVNCEHDCHRFDQSVMSIGLCLYHLIHRGSCLPMSQRNGLFSPFSTINRYQYYVGEIPC